LETEKSAKARAVPVFEVDSICVLADYSQKWSIRTQKKLECMGTKRGAMSPRSQNGASDTVTVTDFSPTMEGKGRENRRGCTKAPQRISFYFKYNH
jgi:hypothetical protein